MITRGWEVMLLRAGGGQLPAQGTRGVRGVAPASPPCPLRVVTGRCWNRGTANTAGATARTLTLPGSDSSDRGAVKVHLPQDTASPCLPGDKFTGRAASKSTANWSTPGGHLCRQPVPVRGNRADLSALPPALPPAPAAARLPHTAGTPCPRAAGSCGIGTAADAGFARFYDGPTQEQRNETLAISASFLPATPGQAGGGLRSCQLSSAQLSSAQLSSAQLSSALCWAKPRHLLPPGRLSRAGHGARPTPAPGGVPGNPQRRSPSTGRKARTLLSRDGLRTFGKRPAALSSAVPV
ncbi:uncharacterized protein LOC131574596 [Poecile atricapillus]|uniref:uncharacterized protein LOC131574596 n=1 Tax=Poecile atricapillus TaxID=48891 RepID=UPI002739E7CB|nr:uncharacterized protein LOC131574596 [Poecile atricapillus]